jgi:hypothetical protein
VPVSTSTSRTRSGEIARAITSRPMWPLRRMPPGRPQEHRPSLPIPHHQTSSLRS